MFLDTCLYTGYWYTKQLLAFNPLILNPYLHPFSTEEATWGHQSLWHLFYSQLKVEKDI